MYSFLLYFTEDYGRILDVSNEKWLSDKNNLQVAIRGMKIEGVHGTRMRDVRTKEDTFFFEVTSTKNQEGESAKTQTCRILIRRPSRLALIDAQDRIQFAMTVLDELAQQFHLSVCPIMPSSNQWANFMQEGTLLEALIATPRGLEDVSQAEGFDWGLFKENPAISASVSFHFKTPFQVRVGQGQLSVFSAEMENLLYIVELVERHLLPGDAVVESQTPC